MAVRACVQCGLSVSETATFCAVCGARFDADAKLEMMADTSAPVAAEAGTPPAVDKAAEPDRWEDNSEWHDATPELVADLATGHVAGHAAQDGDSSLDADTTAESHSAEAGAPVAEAPETPEPAEDPLERRIAGVAALLEEAAGSEETDPGRAAALYGDAILACLDATEDPLGAEAVHAMLLCSFDALSSLLERGGLPEEALAVVDEVASLGMLNGGDEARSEPREKLKGRREDLRRILFADSSQL
jgi:hypothetical protein